MNSTKTTQDIKSNEIYQHMLRLIDEHSNLQRSFTELIGAFDNLAQRMGTDEESVKAKEELLQKLMQIKKAKGQIVYNIIVIANGIKKLKSAA